MPTPETYQVLRQADGAFTYRRDRSALRPEEMLIGRGLSQGEALELVEEFNAAALGLRRAQPVG